MEHSDFWEQVRWGKEDGDLKSIFLSCVLPYSERFSADDSHRIQVPCLWAETVNKGVDERILYIHKGWADCGLIGLFWGQVYLYENLNRQGGSPRRFRIDKDRILKFDPEKVGNALMLKARSAEDKTIVDLMKNF